MKPQFFSDFLLTILVFFNHDDARSLTFKGNPLISPRLQSVYSSMFVLLHFQWDKNIKNCLKLCHLSQCWLGVKVKLLPF